MLRGCVAREEEEGRRREGLRGFIGGPARWDDLHTGM